MPGSLPDGLLGRLLPDGASGAELFTGLSGAGPEPEPDDGLWPEEAAAVAGAVGSRQVEFAAGRRCARLALAGLGLAPVPVPSGERGMPVWPHGVVGSITHCAGYRAAVVAPSALLTGIGVDAEPHAPLPGNVLDLVARPEELDRLADFAGPAGRGGQDRQGVVHADLLLFSAKEAVYKAWFPLGRRVLSHHHVRVDTVPDGSFAAALTSSAPVVAGVPTRYTGRWLVDRGLLLTLAVPLAG